MRDWFGRIRDRLVDKLAALVWEGFCRLELLSGIESMARRRLIRVDVGRTEGVISDLRCVEFQGKQLAEAQSSVGNLRTQEVLYRTQEGKLLVHIKALEKIAGLPTTYSLLSVEETDLVEGGDHEELGRAWRILSLAEVLGDDH